MFLRAFKPAVCPPSNASNPSNPSAGLSKATLAATRPSHLFLSALKPAVCPPSNPSAGLSTATLAATRPSHLFFNEFKPAVCPPSNLSNPLQTIPQAFPRQLSSLPFARLQTFKPFKPLRKPFQGNSRSYTPQPSVFKGVKACRLPALKPSNPQTPPQAFSRQLSQLHAPVCF